MIENPGGSSAPSNSIAAAGTVGVDTSVSMNVCCGSGVCVKSNGAVGAGRVGGVVALVALIGWHATRKRAHSIMKRGIFMRISSSHKIMISNLQTDLRTTISFNGSGMIMLCYSNQEMSSSEDGSYSVYLSACDCTRLNSSINCSAISSL